MNKELETFALKTTLDEIKNTCPDVSNTFIFTVDGKLLITDDDTNEETVNCTAKALKTLFKKAETLGGLETAVFYNSHKRMNVFREQNYYLTIVGSEKNDLKHPANVARILIPTVLKLTEKISNFKQEEPLDVKEADVPEKKPRHVKETSTSRAQKVKAAELAFLREQSETENQLESVPEPPVTQFMVENVGGLLVAADTVRIDNAVMQQWKDLYGERTISEVDVETLNGQTIRCKFKPIKDSKHDGRGIIQLPHKIQQLLHTSKGELVVVKPAIQ